MESKKRVFVGGLSDSLSKEDIEREFSKYGKLNSVWVAQNPPGFAFVEFDDQQDAEEAVKGMNGQTISGCSLRVEHSRERRGRGRGGRGGGGGGRGGFRGSGGRGGGGRGFGPRQGGFDRPRRGGYDGYRGGGGGGQQGWDSYDSQGDGYPNYRSRSPIRGGGGGRNFYSGQPRY